MGETGAVWSYWNETAHKKPAARALATRLGLHLPERLAPGIESGLMYPMRRLIISGEDTPENKAILFGPSWEAGTAQLHKQTRLEVLMCPPPGSSGHFLAEHQDQGTDVWRPRRPRGPSAEEEEKIKRVRALIKFEQGQEQEVKRAETEE